MVFVYFSLILIIAGQTIYNLQIQIFNYIYLSVVQSIYIILDIHSVLRKEQIELV